MTERREGTVLWYRLDKGYGFISSIEEEDVFVHSNNIIDKVILEEGDEVSFILHKRDNGKLFASDVKLID